MIAEDCKTKAKQFGDSCPGRAILDIFHAISEDAQARDLPAATLACPMFDENSDLKPGDWAAEIHFVVRRVA